MNMVNDAQGSVFESIIICDWMRRMSFWLVIKSYIKLRWYDRRGVKMDGDKYDIRHKTGYGYYNIPRTKK